MFLLPTDSAMILIYLHSPWKHKQSIGFKREDNTYFIPSLKHCILKIQTPLEIIIQNIILEILDSRCFKFSPKHKYNQKVNQKW